MIAERKELTEIKVFETMADIFSSIVGLFQLF